MEFSRYQENDELLDPAWQEDYQSAAPSNTLACRSPTAAHLATAYDSSEPTIGIAVPLLALMQFDTDPQQRHREARSSEEEVLEDFVEARNHLCILAKTF